MAKYKVMADAMLESIMHVFQKTIAEDIIRIKVAIDASDFEDLKAVGHKIKGNAGGYGFDQLGEFAKSLEIGAKESDLPKIQEAYDSMVEYLDNVEIEYVEEE
ncbi:MAG: Hpt domain-containing protein [Bacteriovoracaceae bacterium]|nr:Hpt domain-containing protein [Bacteriovoracaceae bacterium]